MMNWFQKTAQLEKQAQKAMPLPKVPGTIPDKDLVDYSGIRRMNNMMSQETADMLNRQHPQIEYGGAGAIGIAYKVGPNEILKVTRDWREAVIAKKVFYTPMDWVVPVLAEPEMIQDNPPLWTIRTKRLRPIDNIELEMYISRLTNDRDFPNRADARSLIKQEEVDEEIAMILYDQVKYIFDQNQQTLLLPDIHGGNVGWDDDGVLKVFDLGPGLTCGQIPKSHYP